MKRRRLVPLGSVLILLAGLGAAVVIYLAAGPEPRNPLGYGLLDSKRDLRQLEVIGGEANVIAVTFLDWFKGLWRGRPLAFTVAALSLVASLVFWLFTAFPFPGDDDA